MTGKTFSQFLNENNINDNDIKESIEEAVPTDNNSHGLKNLEVLIRLGLVNKDKLQTVKRAHSKDYLKWNPTERNTMYELLNSLLDHMVNDQNMFNRVKQTLRTEETDEIFLPIHIVEELEDAIRIAKRYAHKSNPQVVAKHKPTGIWHAIDKNQFDGFTHTKNEYEVHSIHENANQEKDVYHNKGLAHDIASMKTHIGGRPHMVVHHQPTGKFHVMPQNDYHNNPHIYGNPQYKIVSVNRDTFLHREENKIEESIKDFDDKTDSEKRYRVFNTKTGEKHTDHRTAQSAASTMMFLNKKHGSGSHDVKTVLKESKSSFTQKDPPMMVVLKRKAIRQFPNGKRVALYYADKIDKYITIPYESIGDPEDKETNTNIAVSEETQKERYDLDKFNHHKNEYYKLKNSPNTSDETQKLIKHHAAKMAKYGPGKDPLDEETATKKEFKENLKKKAEGHLQKSTKYAKGSTYHDYHLKQHKMLSDLEKEVNEESLNEYHIGYQGPGEYHAKRAAIHHAGKSNKTHVVIKYGNQRYSVHSKDVYEKRIKDKTPHELVSVHEPYNKEEKSLNEVSKNLKTRYVDKAISDHGHASFVARLSDRPKEKEKYSNIARKRAKGISLAFKTAAGLHKFKKKVVAVTEEKNDNKKEKKDCHTSECLAKLNDIVNSKTMGRVKHKDGKASLVDTFTASAILNVHKAVNDDNKTKLERMINKSKEHFGKVSAFAMGAHSK